MHSPANDTSGSELSPREIEVLITIERTGAGLSMVAITLTLVSFFLIKKLRTTPNMFIVLASIANAGASIASMIGYDGLDKGESSALCQGQGFIFEWFMQSDPWWSFAMAFNVFLVFFFNANPATFRKRIWIYCIICFGGPLVPAVVLVSIHDDAKGPVFGNAALWCWVDSNWSLVRLYAYYIPIWICIFGSIIIYVAVGYHVFRNRNRLRNFAVRIPITAKRSDGGTSEAGDSTEESLTRRQDYYGTATTEVQVTSNTPDNDDFSLPMIPPAIYSHGPAIVSCGRSWAVPQAASYYGQSIERFPRPSAALPPARPHFAHSRLDPVKMAYLRTSFIFGFAILITWIPSSVNRLYSLTYDGRVDFQLSIASGIWPIPRRGYRNTVRMDGRLDVVTYGNRNTLELPAMARLKASRVSDDDELELSERFR
ncbi:G protein-coupled glucose receptor regulating gpa2 domain-containing protein [Trichoderma breve]|uniref:G protein-coupled glucose receptor regulating gpa2 domain-containing protein n=1 Tax=Trichoderma breve TaxID=2034170 RepID=A0A9W9B8D8_9HYPO|nr:G protein-coupled glucose receptor regulating gpa2 domain-containing protein [Trichoderma breve]KAJ4854891.1 G protein-coupled glucose receptor regulating gpa2 domain-containing protein [Trichoderma breve]